MTQFSIARGRARTILVDDHPVYRIGLREVLERRATLDIALDATAAVEALAYAAAHPIDLAIVDVLLPDLSGISFVGELRRLRPRCKVLALSMLDDPPRIADMIRAGADGYAIKSEPVEQLLEAIRLVLGGVRYLPAHVTGAEIDALAADPTWPLDRLTTREREVFDLLVAGHSNDAIATRLCIARRTVEAHRMHIMHKLAVKSLVDLARLAWRSGVAGA